MNISLGSGRSRYENILLQKFDSKVRSRSEMIMQASIGGKECYRHWASSFFWLLILKEASQRRFRSYPRLACRAWLSRSVLKMRT